MTTLYVDTIEELIATARIQGADMYPWHAVRLTIKSRDFLDRTNLLTVSLEVPDADLAEMLAKAINAAVSEHRTLLEERAAAAEAGRELPPIHDQAKESVL